MAYSLNIASISDIEKEIQQTDVEQTKGSEMLIYEISSLIDTLHEMDNDETKSMDIIAKHIKWITNAIPSKPGWYPVS